jgi:hypothetical protein
VNDIAAAVAEGKLGMARALDRAEHETAGWTDKALEFLRRYAETHAEFPAYFVTAASATDASFPKVTNHRAWGAVFKMAANERIIKATGRTMPHPKRHGCPAMIYCSLVLK